MTSEDFTAMSERSVDRRTLIKAGVWAAPVVVLATASPAAASSLGVVTYTATASPEGPNGRIRISVRFTSTYGVTKSLTRVAAGDVLPSGASWFKTPDTPVSVSNGLNGRIGNIATVAGAASGQTITFVYSLSTGTTPSSELVTISVTI